METASRYASERDFVANYVLPELKEAAKTLEVSDIVEFHVEKPVNGTADLTADRGGRGLFLIEAKFKKKVGKVTHDIEPRDPAVITQAANYAVNGGYGYYATCNVKRLILFQLAPKKPIECEVSSFEYEAQPEWAKELLKLVLGKVPLKLKQLDDALVDTLLEAHRDLYPRVYQSFQKKLGEKNFKEKYIDWLESQGLQLNDATNRLVAEQATYLQITKLLFYGVVQSLYPAKLKPLRIGEEEEVPQALQRFYEDVKKIDYMPIYQTDIISEIPLSVGAEERVRTLVDTIAEFDFSQMKRDFLSRVYEKLIPPIERKRLGQFYTPPGIVEFILQLTLKDPNAMVLDPGCGSGTFLIGAYNHLRDLNGIPQSMEGGMGERFHQQLLNQVYGIDINQFPAHLSVVGLAIQNPRAKVDKINVVVKDFFDIKRGQATLTGFETLDASGQETVIEFPSYFDVVVANPPYIRQELLGTKEKDKIRKLIEWDYSKATYKAYIGAPPKKSFNGIVLDKQSDIFIYFFIHGISLLRNSGKLGFISSNKWLEVGYGEPFQQFLLNNCKILYVVEFDRAIFPDADVNTAVTILEKCEDKSIRSKNTVRFVRLKRRMEIDIFRDVISKATEGSEDDNMRIILVQQSELEAGKWNVYLRAPKVYQQIVKNSRVKPLGSLITDIFRGPVTGYNEYFIIPKHRAKELGIEPRYLKPCVSSPKKIKGIAIYKEDIDEYFFMVNQPKDELKGTNALEYIQWGEKLEVDVTRGANRGRRKLPELETVSARQLWYAMTQPKEASILFQYLIDARARAFWNIANAHAPNIIHYIVPRTEEHTLPLLGYLNSSVNAMMVELYGRSYGGGVLKIEIYELKKLPVIDPNTLSQEDKEKIVGAFKELVRIANKRVKIEEEMERKKSKSKKDAGLFEKEMGEGLRDAMAEERDAQHKLDQVIYDILGLSKQERIQVEQGLEELQGIRRLRTKT